MTTPDDVFIRPAAAEDATVIKTTIARARLDRTGLDWRRFKLAVNSQGEVLGMCQVRHYWDTRELGSLWVREDLRKRGLGGLLVRAWLAEEDPPLYLETVQTNESYYEKFGFRRIPVMHAPRGLRLKSAIGGTLVRLVARQRIIVMRWDDAANSPAVLPDQRDERDR